MTILHTKSSYGLLLDPSRPVDEGLEKYIE